MRLRNLLHRTSGDRPSATTTRVGACDDFTHVESLCDEMREDLGGEEIVYLESSGQTLTSVDRHTLPAGDLDAVSVSIRPSDIAVFRPGSGERLGRGAGAEGVLNHG